MLEIAEDEVRRAEPVMATRGRRGAQAPRPDGATAARCASRKRDLRRIVRGVITREYQTTPEARRQRRLATLDPGTACTCTAARTHVRSSWIPPHFDFGPGGAPSGAQLQIASWIDRLFPGVPRTIRSGW